MIDIIFIEFYIRKKYAQKLEEEFDHIIQLATALNEDDLLRLNHYTNFQPLEIDKNRSKNFKY